MTPKEIIARAVHGGDVMMDPEKAEALAQAAIDALEATGVVIVDRSWVAKVALLLHTMAGEGVELTDEDPWELFMATGPILGFDENYTSDDDLRAMIAASEQKG